MAKILNQTPPALSEYNPKVPPALEKAISKCLQKNRDQRYQKASELLTDLRTAQQELDKMQILARGPEVK